MKRNARIRLDITPEEAERRRIAVEAVLVLLKHVRAMLDRSGATKTATRVRWAIASTKGALRHARSLETWAGMLDRAEKCIRCGRLIALCRCDTARRVHA